MRRMLPPMRRKNALNEASERLKAAGASDAVLDAQLLMAHVCGVPRLTLLLALDDPLDDAQASAFFRLLALRVSGLPLQYVLGEAHFMGHVFQVDARVLIPRWDTEGLCEAAIARVKKGDHVLDMGAGSGAIAISVALACPYARVVAADISGEALSVARANAKRLGAKVQFVQSDLYAALSQRFDIIISNPPYIPSREIGALQPEVQKEPVLALDGGADGLRFYRGIVAGLPSHLVSGGSLLLEVGDGQSEQVAACLAGLFETISIQRDLNHLERIVIGDGYAG